MADRKPLVLVDGELSQIPDTDVLYCQTYATQVIGLSDAAKDSIGLDCVKDSSTIHWTYDSTNKQLIADIISESITNSHIAENASIAWSKIDKSGSNLADITVRNHNDLQSIQGGQVGSYFHLNQNEHDTLTTGLDASSLHNHNSLYFTKDQLSTAGEATVDWSNISNTPATYPPSAHTHTASDITDLTEAVQDIVGAFLTDTNSIHWYYDDSGNLLYASVKLTNSSTISLSAPTVNGIQADIISESITNSHIAEDANIAWAKIDKIGSKLGDIDNVNVDTIQTGQSIIYDGNNFVPANLVTDSSLEAHRTQSPIDHPDGSITKSKLASNIDASDIGFIADKVDGADLNDSGTTTTDIWSAARIISFVNNQVENRTIWLNPVKDKDLCTPPLSPSDGDRYIVCANSPSGTAQGDWVGCENYIAQYDASTSSWNLQSPLEGDTVCVEDEDKIYGYNGSEWVVKFIGVNDHEQLNDLLGGAPNEHFHLTANEHNLLTANVDASAIHNHNILYYTKDELNTANSASIDWTNIINTPTSYPPSAHTHTSSDITDFDSAVKDIVDSFIEDSDTIEWTYDSTSDTLSATVKDGSITWDKLSFDSIPWSNIDKTGSKLSDIDNCNTPSQTNQLLRYNIITNTWDPIRLFSTVNYIPYKCLTSGPIFDEALSYPIYIHLNGFRYKGKYSTIDNTNEQDLTEIYTIKSALSFTNVDQGSLVDSNWYSMFIVLDPTSDLLVGCLSLIQRVNEINYVSSANQTIITFGEQSNPSSVLTTAQLGWSEDKYSIVNGQLLCLTGSYEGQIFNIISNTSTGQASITVSGDLSSLQQGDWLLLSPQGYSKFKHIGESYLISTSPISWRPQYSASPNTIYYSKANAVFSGTTNNAIEQIDLSAIIPPTATQLLETEVIASGFELSCYLDENGLNEVKHTALQGYFIFYDRQEIGNIPINTKLHTLYIKTSYYLTLVTRGFKYGD